MVQRQTQQPDRSGLNQAEVNAVQLEKFIMGVDFPCSKETLIHCAKENHAPEEMLRIMQGFSRQDYASPMEVTEQFSQARY
jgi:hypothetical protein